MQFEYNIGVGGPKSFRGYAAKLEDKWVRNQNKGDHVY
jgi:hypothetical protein